MGRILTVISAPCPQKADTREGGGEKAPVRNRERKGCGEKKPVILKTTTEEGKRGEGSTL